LSVKTPAIAGVVADGRQILRGPEDKRCWNFGGSKARSSRSKSFPCKLLDNYPPLGVFCLNDFWFAKIRVAPESQVMTSCLRGNLYTLSCRGALIAFLAMGALLAIPLHNAEAGLITSLDEASISAIDVNTHPEEPLEAPGNSLWWVSRFGLRFLGISHSFNSGVSTTTSHSSSIGSNVSPMVVEEALLVTGLPFTGWVVSQASLLATPPDPLLLFRPPRA
jgi:hypothetical protein